MRRSARAWGLGLVLAMTSFPGFTQDGRARGSDPQRHAEAERQRAAEAAARASVGPSVPGADLQRLECRAAQRNFQLLCSRRMMETAWEARECAEAAAEARNQCPSAATSP